MRSKPRFLPLLESTLFMASQRRWASIQLDLLGDDRSNVRSLFVSAVPTAT